MTRVIQDSDDESDLSSPLKLQERELQVSGSHDSKGEKLAPPTNSTSSTGMRCHPSEIQSSDEFSRSSLPGDRRRAKRVVR